MQQLLDSPEKDFISPAEDYDNIKLQEVEEFDVQRPGPSEVKVCKYRFSLYFTSIQADIMVIHYVGRLTHAIGLSCSDLDVPG